MKIIGKLLFVFLTFFWASLYSQDDLALAISKAQSENQDRLKQYSWKRTAKASVDGVEKFQRLEQMRFNSKGELEAIEISSQASVKKKRGIRGAVQKGKIQDNEEFVHQVLGQVFSYIFLSKGQMVDLFDKALIVSEGDLLKVKASSIQMDGDEVHFVYNKNDYTRLEQNVGTSVGDDKVKAQITFNIRSDGTNHSSIIDIEIPSRQMILHVENFDYIKQ